MDAYARLKDLKPHGLSLILFYAHWRNVKFRLQCGIETSPEGNYTEMQNKKATTPEHVEQFEV